jgi:hypothetical protein
MTFEDQLRQLIAQAEDPVKRLENGLVEALSIMQDAKRHGADAAAQHILALLMPQQKRPMSQDELDAQFYAQRPRQQH